MRLPFSDLGWPVDHDGLRRVAPLQRRQINEKLEQRARLPLGLRGAIELTGFIIATTDHRQNCAVFAERDERSLRDILLCTLRLQPARDDPLGDPLQLQVQRRAQRQIAR